MALGTTIFFNKLSEGSVSLFMQDADGILPSRWFVMDGRMPRIGVPLNYALGVFTDASLKHMLDNNYFEVENVDALVKAAQEKGFIALSEEEEKEIQAPRRKPEVILAILKGGNADKIRELFESSDKERAFDIAIKNSKSLSVETVRLIEEILGMAILEE